MLKLKTPSHFEMKIRVPSTAFGLFYGLLRQIPELEDAVVEMADIYAEDQEPAKAEEPKAVYREDREPTHLEKIRAEARRAHPGRFRDTPVNRNRLTGEERRLARQATREGGQAIFDAIWPELQGSGNWLISRERVLEAGKQLRMSPDQAVRCSQWLLDKSWLTVRDRGLYYVGSESPQYKALEAETAPETPKAA